MTINSNTLYLRSNGQVKGPYPAGLISRYILLGRISDKDEVSEDGQEWVPIKDVPTLIPKVMRGDSNDPLVQERLQAARRWADERSVDRRDRPATAAQHQAGRRDGDRREEELQKLIEYRQKRVTRDENLLGASQSRWTVLMIIGTIAIVGGVFLFLYKPPPPQLGADCQSPAAPNINWSNCVLDGAHLDGANLSGAKLYSASMTAASLVNGSLNGSNLSYASLSIANLRGADLRGAIMVGARLREAKLNNARLEGADLAYADLTGADITGVRLKNTKFDNAIWTDGKRCLPGSIDTCLLPK